MSNSSSVDYSKLTESRSVSDVTLENGENRDSARNDKLLRNVLMVILGSFMLCMFLTLLLMVINLNHKVNNMEKGAFLVEDVEVDITRELETHGASGDGHVHSGESENAVREIPKPSDTGLHLMGMRPYLRIDNDAEIRVESISNWQDKSNSGVTGKLRLVDNTSIRVEEDGLYLIYAQLTWRKTQGMAIFDILRSDEDQPASAAAGVSLSKCINNFHEKYAVMKTCYTSVTVSLSRGSSVKIAVVKDDFSIDFNNGRSFFGVVNLDNTNSGKIS